MEPILTNHECEGEWVPPSTAGGTQTRVCKICGKFDTEPTLKESPLYEKPGQKRIYIPSTGNTSGT